MDMKDFEEVNEMNVGCKLCSYAIEDSFDKCPDCGRVFETCILCGNKVLQKSPQNLPKASHDSLLAEVRALKARNEKLTDIINWMSNGYGIDHMESEYDIEMAELESGHFS